jgi:methyltransferase (TIGR00027 family)
MAIVDPISQTGRWTAAARAVENLREDRLYSDPYAEALAGREGFALKQRMELARQLPGVESTTEHPYLTIRTKFFDNYVEATLAASSTRQVVLVASGLDTRAFRLEWPSGTCVFELDREEVLQAKRHVLEGFGARPRCDLRTVAVDLQKPWDQALIASGFDRSSPALWIVEGLLMYLEDADAKAVLAQISGLAASGSSLVTDIVGLSVFGSEWSQPLLRALASANAPWIFGCDRPEDLLGPLGWTVLVHRPGESGAHFGRWPYPLRARGTRGVPETFLVTGTRA